MGLRLVAIAIAIAVLFGTRAAHADDKPWANGVSAGDQKAALALYQQGNALFEDSNYREALPKYEEALKLWKHPAIAYNAAICLINLDHPVDAYNDLEIALKYGPAPIGKDLYREGQTHQSGLAKQVAELEVSCREPQAEVTMDGQPLLSCPSTVKQRTLAGEHLIVAVKPKFETVTQKINLPSITLQPGKPYVLVLEMKLSVPHRKLVRRWATWKPWAVMGGGAGIALVAVPLALLAKSSYSDYDAKVVAACPTGCLESDPALAAARDAKSRADTEKVATFSALAVGSAIAATGFALIVLNQPHFATISPTIGTVHAGLIISGRW